MRSFYRYAFSVCLIILSACKDKVLDNPLTISCTWNCTEHDYPDSLVINNIFPVSRVVQLEDTVMSVIGRVDKLISHDSILCVVDKDLTKKIFLFNSYTGKFINAFGTLGSGPGEYIILNDVSFDEYTSQIKVLCNKNKVLSFNLQGGLISATEIPFKAVNMEIYDKLYYFFSDDYNLYEVIVTDSVFNKMRSFFPNKHNPIIHMLIHPFSKSISEGISYMRYMDNNIYQIHGADSISIKYRIDFGENAYERSMAEKDGEEIIEQNLLHTRGRLKYFTENDETAIIVFFNNGEPYISILNKNDNTVNTVAVANIFEKTFGSLLSPIEYSSGNGFYEVIEYLPDNIMFNRIGDNPIVYHLGK